MGLLSWLTGCTAESTDRVQAGVLLENLRSGQKPLLIDVRQPEELSGPLGSLPGVKNIPLPELEKRYAEIPKDRPVILICRSGHRSLQALKFLQSRGYTQVKDVEGGMNAVRALEPR
jgi:rhodanese-related sulfurtransferase